MGIILEEPENGAVAGQSLDNVQGDCKVGEAFYGNCLTLQNIILFTWRQ